jgi:hypothetical protein
MDEMGEFIPPHSLSTSVLFLIFNRPDTTQQVFDEIRKAQPPQLFVAADGPRKDRPADYELCKKTRDIIQQVNWDCKVFTRFQDKNLGCKIGVSSAIDWFFSNVDKGIILEDDCVPNQSFFPFCQELLEKYREDERVMMISGMNYLFNKIEMNESYFFSRYYPVWGWATWKRAWSQYDLTMSDWPEYNSQNFLNHIYCHTKIAGFLQEMFQKAYSNKIDTWDIQWVFTCVVNSGISISPKYNLTSNIGVTGSHADNVGRFHYMPVKALNVTNICHPRHVIPNITLDKISFDEITKSESVPAKIRGLFYHIRKSKTK